MDRHEDCLKCNLCDARLGEVGSTLYQKADMILCKRDYLRYVIMNQLHSLLLFLKIDLKLAHTVQRQ